MKKIVSLILTIFTFIFGVAQTSVADYTIIGNKSTEITAGIDTLNGFLYLAGNTNECESNDGVIIKYKGDSLYKRVLIGNDQHIEIIESIATKSENYIFVGGYTDQNSDYDILLAKLDTQLNITTQKVIGMDEWNFCHDISIAQNNIIGVGKTHNGLDYDAFIFKTDHNLDTIWTRSLNAPNDQQLNKVIAYNDSTYIATGFSQIDGMGKEVYLLSINSNTGDTLWSKTIGGVNDDFCNSIIKSQDGGILGFGTTSSYTSDDEDTFLFKTDGMGTFLWSNLHQVQSSANTLNENGIDLFERQNGDIIVVATTESFGPTVGAKSTMVMKTNSSGDWLNGYIYDGGQDDFPVGMIKVNDTLFYVCGEANSNTHGYSDFYILNMSTNDISSQINTNVSYKDIPLVCFADIEKSTQAEEVYSIFPNPIQQSFQIQAKSDKSIHVEIYDLLGNIVLNKAMNTNMVYQFPNETRKGIYFIRVTDENKTINQYKIIYDNQY